MYDFNAIVPKCNCMSGLMVAIGAMIQNRAVIHFFLVSRVANSSIVAEKMDERPLFRRSGLPARVVRPERGWMLSCVSGRDWLLTLLSGSEPALTGSWSAPGRPGGCRHRCQGCRQCAGVLPWRPPPMPGLGTTGRALAWATHSARTPASTGWN